MNIQLVSVSLRSIIHSYLHKSVNTHLRLSLLFPSPYGVSFILIFNYGEQLTSKQRDYGFRLLTEYHSFL